MQQAVFMAHCPYQKRLARMEEDKEQERYLQEYAKRKQEKKNRKEGKR